MLPKVLTDYLALVEKRFASLDNCYIEKYEEEILSSKRINLKIRVRFLKGHLLEINEAIVYIKPSFKHLNYRYHFQDEKNNLIFRYDNTPHFPDLDSFPHHKHLPDHVMPAKQPKIYELLNDVSPYLG
jgi:hypothetical protein